MLVFDRSGDTAGAGLNGPAERVICDPEPVMGRRRAWRRLGFRVVCSWWPLGGRYGARDKRRAPGSAGPPLYSGTTSPGRVLTVIVSLGWKWMTDRIDLPAFKRSKAVLI